MDYDRAERRPPVITDEDRQWALDQEPGGWSEEVYARWLLLPAATREDDPLTWWKHVAEQIERFEAYFAGDRKTRAEWSGMWRRKWWPEADASIIHPREAPHVPHPFVTVGHPAWADVLAVLTPPERKVAMRFGVAQFKPDDPRAKLIEANQ